MKEKQSRGEGGGKKKTICKVCGKLLGKDYVRRHMKMFHKADGISLPRDDVKGQFASLASIYPYPQETHSEDMEKERLLLSLENENIAPDQ